MFLSDGTLLTVYSIYGVDCDVNTLYTKRVEQMSKKGYMVRTSKRTVLAVNMIAGRLKGETGKQVSVDDVLWDWIEKTYPDIAKIATKTAAEEAAEEAAKERDDESEG